MSERDYREIGREIGKAALEKLRGQSPTEAEIVERLRLASGEVQNGQNCPVLLSSASVVGVVAHIDAQASRISDLESRVAESSMRYESVEGTCRHLVAERNREREIYEEALVSWQMEKGLDESTINAQAARITRLEDAMREAVDALRPPIGPLVEVAARILHTALEGE